MGWLKKEKQGLVNKISGVSDLFSAQIKGIGLAIKLSVMLFSCFAKPSTKKILRETTQMFEAESEEN